MDHSKLHSHDKVRQDSIAVLPLTRTGRDKTITQDTTLSPHEELVYLVYIGSSNGSIQSMRVCITQNGDGTAHTTKVSIVARRLIVPLAAKQRAMTNADEFASMVARSVAETAPNTRGDSEAADGNSAVTFLHINRAMQEPRLIVLIGGELLMLHYLTLELIPVFRGLLGLGRIRACAPGVFHEDRGSHCLAVVTGCHLVCVAYDEVGCRVMNYNGPTQGALESMSPAGQQHQQRGALASSRHTEISSLPDSDLFSESLTDVDGFNSTITSMDHGSGAVTAGAPSPSPLAAAAAASFISVPDGVTQILWDEDTIVVGTKRQYCVYDVYSQRLIDHLEVDTDMPNGPLLRYFAASGNERSMVLMRIGTRLALYDIHSGAGMDTTERLPFPEAVIDAAYCPPFLVGVRTDGKITLRSCIDNEEFPLSHSMSGLTGMPRALLPSPLCLFALTAHSAEVLIVAPQRAHIAALIRREQYARAAAHCEATVPEGSEDYDRILRGVYEVSARHAWGKKNYVESLKYFEMAGTPTAKILDIIPELRYCDPSKLDKDRIPVSLSSGVAFRALYDLFLRRRLSNPAAAAATPTAKDSPDLSVVPGNSPRSPMEGTAADPGNFAAVAEQRAIEFGIFMLFVLDRVTYTESELAEHFLSSWAVPPLQYLAFIQEDGPLPRPMIAPLVLACAGEAVEALARCRKLGMVYAAVMALQIAGDAALFEEHLPWMLKLSTPIALQAICSKQWRPPPVSTVLPLMMSYNGEPLHEYLHFIVYQEGNIEAAVHTLYALNLIDVIKKLRRFHVEGFASPELHLQPGEEAGIVGHTRSTLINFLRDSDWYDGDVVLANLRMINLEEEQIVVHAKIGDHVGALTILVYDLDNIADAVHYCVQQHHGTYFAATSSSAAATAAAAADSPLPNMGHTAPWDAQTPWVGGGGNDSVLALRNDVLRFPSTSTCADAMLGSQLRRRQEQRFNEYFNILLYVLLVPPEGFAQRLDAALDLLRDQSRSINPLSVMESLPGEVCVAEISSYLVRTFQSLKHDVQLTAVLAQNVRSVAASVSAYHSILTQRSIFMEKGRKCVVCEQPLEDSLFAVFPNLSVAHFRCYGERCLDPARGVPFRTMLM